MSAEANDYLAEGVDDDKMHGLKTSKSSPVHQDNVSLLIYYFSFKIFLL